MKITVYNRIPVTADVSVEQVELHIVRAGRGHLLPLIPKGAESNSRNIIRSAVELLAAMDDRQPGDVLASIVEGAT